MRPSSKKGVGADGVDAASVTIEKHIFLLSKPLARFAFGFQACARSEPEELRGIIHQDRFAQIERWVPRYQVGFNEIPSSICRNGRYVSKSAAWTLDVRRMWPVAPPQHLLRVCGDQGPSKRRDIRKNLALSMTSDDMAPRV